MKQTITLPEVSDAVRSAYRYIYAMQGLLNSLEATFYSTLDGARKEAGASDDREGSFWWMQDHYNEVGASILATNVLAESLVQLLDEMDRKLPAGISDEDSLPKE